MVVENFEFIIKNFAFREMNLSKLKSSFVICFFFFAVYSEIIIIMNNGIYYRIRTFTKGGNLIFRLKRDRKKII